MAFKKSTLQILFLLLIYVLYPIIFIYSINIDEVDFLHLIPSIIISSFVALIVFAAFRIFFKNPLKRALAAAPVIFILWNFERCYEAVTGRNFRYIYFMLVIFILYAIFMLILFKVKKQKSLSNIYTLLVAPMFALMLFNIVVLVTNLVKKDKSETSNEELITPAVAPFEKGSISIDSMPDIYLIILDEMASFKTMNKNYDGLELDAKFFEDEGFFFADSTIVRYADTKFSMPTLLNMEYFTDPIDQETYYNYFHRSDKRTGSESESQLKGMNIKYMISKWGNNFLFNYLKERGYEVNVAEAVSQLLAVRFDSDRHISPRYVGKFEISTLSNYLDTNVLNPYTLELIYNSLFKLPFAYYNDAFVTKHIFDYLKTPSENPNRPQFTMAHLICPHSPFIFKADGEVKPMMSNLSDKKEAYLEQYLYVVSELQEIVKSIKKHSNDEAVIIIQSDHGPRPHMTGFSDYKEAFHIFNTIYFPDRDYINLHNTIAQPNTFRVVLNKYFEENFEMLEDY